MTTPSEGPEDTPADESAVPPPDSPSRKRARVEAAPDTITNTTTTPTSKTALRETLLDPTHVTALRQAYLQALGYPHCVVQDVLDPSFFRDLREEMVGSLSATFKETDLYKLYQTGDLANLDTNDPDITDRLSNLLALRQAIYSQTFRAFVRKITGCQPLTDRTDCSSNLYAQGCHLLCHDDVIGTRCIAYIIYLTDPEETWEEMDGGALEIYPPSEPGKLGVPAVAPVKSYLPLPNTMAFFAVLPGQSFHAVEEVYKDGKMRLSVSGWYHAAATPSGVPDLASSNQPQARRDDDSTVFSTLPQLPSLSIATDSSLAKWVNPTYLKPGAMEQILTRFQEDGSILLHGFLLPEVAQRAATLFRRQDEIDGVGHGIKAAHGVGFVKGTWVPVGPPHKQRYMRLVAGPAATEEKEDSAEKDSNNSHISIAEVALFLTTLRDELFGSAVFALYLARLTGVEPSTVNTEARRFRPGLDYTLAHYGIVTKDHRLDATLSFVDDEKKGRKAAWGSGDVGGFECYIKAEEGNDGVEAAESYRRQAQGKEEEEEDVLTVFAAHNALSLVLRQTRAMRFVKYVSATAPGSRWDVISEYSLRQGGKEEGKYGGVEWKNVA
ncbi:hsp90 chloroplast targeted [Nannochloropsis oceanica]